MWRDLDVHGILFWGENFGRNQWGCFFDRDLNDLFDKRFVDVKLEMKFRNDITVYGYYYDSCGFLGELRFPREELLLERIGKIISRSPRSLLIKRYDVEECSFPCWLLAAEFPSIRIIYETLLQKLKITDGYSGIGMERSSTKSECSMATNSR